MFLYLDNCSFNRPFDNQNDDKIYEETLAKLQIQEEIYQGKYKLAWSYILDYENAANPFPERKQTIASWKKRAITDTGETDQIIQIANHLYSKNIKAKDALHVACAVKLHCNFFITTDKDLLKKCSNFEKIKVINPVDFINLETV
jgi:predicted nucleic acid-binding protein